MINDPQAVLRIIDAARRVAPNVPLLVRTHYVADRDRLLKLGASDVIVEEYIHGRELYIAVLETGGSIKAMPPRELFFDKVDKLSKIERYVPSYDLIVINGNISYPFSENGFKERVSILDNLMSTNKVIYNIGNLDYKLSLTQPAIREWLKDKPNVINLTFKNGYKINIINGGVNNKINNLINNIECTFINYINGQSWHELYNGKFGYIISNMPLNNELPKFYAHSARIGTAYKNDMIIYGQEVGLNGLLNTIEI